MGLLLTVVHTFSPIGSNVEWLETRGLALLRTRPEGPGCDPRAAPPGTRPASAPSGHLQHRIT